MFVENVIIYIKVNWWKVGVVVVVVNLFLRRAMPFLLFFRLCHFYLMFFCSSLLPSMWSLPCFFSQQILNIEHVPDTRLGAGNDPSAVQQTWILSSPSLQTSGGRIVVFILSWLRVHLYALWLYISSHSGVVILYVFCWNINFSWLKCVASWVSPALILVFHIE